MRDLDTRLRDPKFTVPFAQMLREKATATEIIARFELTGVAELRRVHRNMLRRGMKLADLPSTTVTIGDL
jgi:hypothetical protein